MNTRKQPYRFLAILLSLFMLTAMLPVTAFAAGEETVISSDTTWEAQTISNDVRIASGVTLTINGAITIEGTVTITGGGTIVRGSGDAYFKIGSGASLTADGVTVDGAVTSSAYSMFDVDDGMLTLKNSTVQSCVKTTSDGGAINMYDGTLIIENSSIKNCSVTSYGGAIYLDNGADATIKSGTFSGNKTTNTSSYGGGFIYNRMSTLTIDGGNFQNNSSNGRGGAIYNTGLDGTKTYIRGGAFSGNTSSYTDYEGSGAVFFSSDNTADTVLYISGSVRFGDGEEHSGQDGILLGTNSTYNVLRKMQIRSALQYPINIYVACVENRVIAEGVEDYRLTAADMTRLKFHDTGSSGTDWYAWLNSENNEVYVSETEPIYVVYDANGATGSVTDNSAYTSESQVTVQSADGLTYEGYTFKGWNTAKDGSGTMYYPGNTFNINKTTTLYAQWEGVTSLHCHAICGEADCGHDGHAAVVYTALDDGEGNIADGITTTGGYYSNVLSAGNYYLTEDITNVNLSIEITGTVNLCLNGHTISGSAAYGIFRIGAGGVLNVCDCKGGGKIAESNSHNPVLVHSGGVLNLYGGTIESRITAVVIDEDPSENTDSTGGTVNIHSGTVSSTGSASQAIKVNAGMTNAAVNLSGGSVISQNRGISAESGEIGISGGEINANSYALNIDNSAVRVYLSGSPVISGSTADTNIYAVSSASNAVLVLHAKDSTSSAYTGGDLSIDLISANADYYVAQGVSDAGMLEKLSLAGADDYYLAYDATNQAIQIKEYTYTVTLPSGQEGYTVTAASGSTSPVKKGGSFSFSVTISDKYYKTDSFAVEANGTTLTPEANGVYTISNIIENQTVAVEGVALDNTLPTAEIRLGENKWNTFLNNITFGLFFKETRTVTISAVDNESGVEKTEYFVSDTAYADSDALEDAAIGKWETYSASFSIEPNSKNIIYAKITDKVGNVSYASSNGIVLYTDAAQKTKSISFTKTGTADVTAEVTLNGNTIDKIYCDSTLLASGTHYTVNGGTITFKASWLNTLSAGDHTLTIYYNPLGVAYVVDDGKNDAPATTTIALSVQKATGSVAITNDISKVYDGSAVPDVTYNTDSTGTVNVEYKSRDAEDNKYITDKPFAVGKYTVRVTVEADDDYTDASATADFEIIYLTTPSKPFEISGTSGDNGWYTSDVMITPPEGHTVSEALNGEYSEGLTISASAENVKLYLKNESGQMTGAISVGNIKIDKDDPVITANGDTNIYLQSDTARITVSDSNSGVAKVEVQKNNGEFVDITASYESGYSVTENGTYTFRVTDNAGRTAEKILVYNRIDTQKPVVTIDATHGGAAYTDSAWTNKDITLTPENETANLGTTAYQYRVDGGEWQDYISSIVISADTDADGTVYEFKATSASGVESDAVSITVKRDTAAPDGDITIKENSIRQFLNTITFGLFFNEDVDIAITGTDALSGVASIRYYRSAKILTENELASLAWTEYDSAIHETAKDAEKFIYYVKVTDKAGNATLFGSDGVTFDLTASSITGVMNGATCYTTQKITVTDLNFASVTLNSAPAVIENGVLMLSGNTEATYTITATDKAGNRTTVTVTMKTIASLSENIDGLTAANVMSTDEETVVAVKTAAGNVNTENATAEEKAALQDILDNCDNLIEKIDVTTKEISDVISGVGGYDTDSVKSWDKADIEALVERIDTLLNNGNLTEAEKENLETVKNTAETLLEKVDETTGAGNTENIQNVQDVTPNNVKPKDKVNLEAAKDDIEQALNDYADNYTKDEKAQLEETLKQIEEALGVIQRVEKAEEVISALPESVSPDDTEAEEQIHVVKEIYDGMSEYEKSLISYEAAAKLESLLAQLDDYRIIEGNGSIWTKESGDGLTFTANGDCGKFTGIEIDGSVVNAENYTAKNGSTVITLKQDYLNTLTAGEHVITMLYTDGKAVGTFTIAEKPVEPSDAAEPAKPADENSASPETGYDVHIINWIILMLIFGGTVLALSVRRRSKKA